MTIFPVFFHTFASEMTSLEKAYAATAAFVESIPKAQRKRYGQFFTSRKSAEYMAGLFSLQKEKTRQSILDAGAGTGLLSIALVEHLRNEGYNGQLFVCCYETDNKVLPVLTANLDELAKRYNITYQIITDNFLLEEVQEERYDIVIGNPPYLKIPKDAPEAQALPEVCYGAPNLYFLFWAKSIQQLRPGGELVYIIPRSWTSGAYFARFRNFLFRNCVITDIHIFDSREKVFDGESVLQETMIIKVRKTVTHPEHVSMTASSSSDFADLRHYEVAYNAVVAPNEYVFLVTSAEESQVLTMLNRLPDTLQTVQMKMHTGIIVDFRTREVLRNKAVNGAVPLFYSHHIRNGRVVWPAGEDGEYMVTDRTGFLQANGNYVFVKRFTSKEEHRRLQCGILLATDYPQYEHIGTQNKINFIKCATAEEAYGIYILLNSTLYDSYYRILNGSTQVNSTEINAMPVPSHDTIIEMGQQLMVQNDLSEATCNNIIRQWIT